MTESVTLTASKKLRGRRVRLWECTAALRKRVQTRVKDPRPVTKAFRDNLYEANRDSLRPRL